MNINQIAEAVSVSKRTVTRALNNEYGIKKETKERVLKIIKKHNYQPSTIARALKTKKTKVIALLIPENSNPFYAKLTEAVEKVADNNGYSIILMNTYKNYQKETKCIDLCQEKWVDGVLSTPTQTSDKKNILKLEKAGIPLVLMNRHFEDKNTDYVINDNILGGYLATSHLLEHGYKKIAYISSYFNISSSFERLEGYKKALKKFNLSFDENLVVETEPTIEGGEKAIGKLLSNCNKPQAVFSFCDLIAAGVFKSLKKKDIEIGKDIGLVGYDDIELASFMEVPLTTICQPAYEIGKISTEILIDKLLGKRREPQQIVLKPSLVIRGSCGCNYE